MLTSHVIHVPHFTLVCTSDSDCFGDQKCFQRADDDSPTPPGCGGDPIGSNNYCYDPYCEDQLAYWEQQKEDIGDLPFHHQAYDDSIALLFGNGTTIGQVCSYSKGLEEEVVEDVPGFCCMDAPYEADDWGEVVRMDRITNLLCLVCTDFYFLFDSMHVKST